MTRANIPSFESNILRIVCISDTHNEDPRAVIPPGDVFIHAGDMTDDGTFAELQNAFEWISSLPHKVKLLVAGTSPGRLLLTPHALNSLGNHDVGLDPAHPNFSPEAHELFTSSAARQAGIHYLDRQVRTVAQYIGREGTSLALKVYCNPSQPDFLNTKPYAFMYAPAPSPDSTAAWSSAPCSLSEAVKIWVVHSPPLHRLDAVNVAGLTGCAVEAERVGRARPALCVFGHYHYSWGAERVRWMESGNGIEAANVLTLSGERKREEGLNALETKTMFNFSGEDDSDQMIEVGRETLFINSAWMTMKKSQSAERNQPIVVRIAL